MEKGVLSGDLGDMSTQLHSGQHSAAQGTNWAPHSITTPSSGHTHWRGSASAAPIGQCKTMRLVIQRVTEASVTVDGEVTGAIGRGLCVLCGIHEGDTDSAAEWAAKKLCSIRLWEDSAGKPWAQSAAQGKYDLLLVSQFTLFATLKGNKPDFHHAMGPDKAKPFW